ncbi:MAG TPA: cytochrome c3 family protein [Deltaproteobacteria bacterium]|nr:cytochrome c3 family protein [Deltaproteobacteria bacterium]
MAPKKELKLAYYIAGILLFVGAMSYAAFPVKVPDQPRRIMFESIAGKVFFDHKTHSAEAGYGLSCIECHHELEEGETDPQPQRCGDCHEADSGDEDMPKKSDAFHKQCTGCHEEFNAGPLNEKCNSCHVLL